MSVCIGSCGRSGTNLVLEVLRGNSFFCSSKAAEDKQFFKRHKKYPQDYLTKCDTVYYTLNDADKTLELNPNLTIMWTMRDPRDMVLSKIRRGQPKSKGGDGSNKLSDDATPQGCIEDMCHSHSYYLHFKQHYGNRLLVVKMEDVILDIEKESKRLCEQLGLKWEVKMTDPVPRLRVADKRKRYTKLDVGQIGLWKHWRDVYDGFFVNADYIPNLFDKVEFIRREFSYQDN